MKPTIYRLNPLKHIKQTDLFFLGLGNPSLNIRYRNEDVIRSDLATRDYCTEGRCLQVFLHWFFSELCTKEGRSHYPSLCHRTHHPNEKAATLRMAKKEYNDSAEEVGVRRTLRDEQFNPWAGKKKRSNDHYNPWAGKRSSEDRYNPWAGKRSSEAGYNPWAGRKRDDQM